MQHSDYSRSASTSSRRVSGCLSNSWRTEHLLSKTLDRLVLSFIHFGAYAVGISVGSVATLRRDTLMPESGYTAHSGSNGIFYRMNEGQHPPVKSLAQEHQLLLKHSLTLRLQLLALRLSHR